MFVYKFASGTVKIELLPTVWQLEGFPKLPLLLTFTNLHYVSSIELMRSSNSLFRPFLLNLVFASDASTGIKRDRVAILIVFPLIPFSLAVFCFCQHIKHGQYNRSPYYTSTIEHSNFSHVHMYIYLCIKEVL